jgi:hypothetical protein
MSPTVTIDRAADQDPVSTSDTVYFDVVFSEPVTGFGTQSVMLDGSAGAANVEVIETAPLNGTTFRVIVTAARNGTLIASIPAGVVSDAAGNLNLASTSTDNMVVIDAFPAPHIVGVVIDDGTVQRSRVRSITVIFDTEVTLDADAFSLMRSDGHLVGVIFTTSVLDGRTVAVLTFAGDGLEAGSLADGRYMLMTHRERVHSAIGGLSSDRVDTFFRFFGDVNGDGDVDRNDTRRFRRAFGSTAGDAAFRAAFDFDGDGDVDRRDRNAFRQRRRASVLA